MSGHAEAASADLAAKSPERTVYRSHDEQLSKRKADGKSHSERKRNEDAEIQSESDESGEKPVSKSPERKVSKPYTGIREFTASNDASRQPGPASFLDGFTIPGFTASNDASRQPGPASFLDGFTIPGFTASHDASGQPGPASLLDTGIPGFTDNGVKERQKRRFTQKGMRNRQQSKRKQTAEKEYLGYSDYSEYTANASIFKVRMFLKDIKREAYVPQRVSLGPYHEGRPGLPPMKHHKGRALRRMMIRRNKRTGNDSNDMDFAFRARNEILKLEDKIRGIYQEPIHCDGEMLAQMVCWDGCFILEVLRTLGRDRKEKTDPSFGRDPNEENDPIFGENQVAASNLLKDILMLENQIPCIVLENLLQLEDPRDEHVTGTLFKVLVDGTYGLFKFSEDKTALMKCKGLFKADQPTPHLLAFLHKVIVHRSSNPVKPKDQAKNCIGHCLIMLQDTNNNENIPDTNNNENIPDTNNNENIPPAVELKYAGIKFLSFKGGIKEIDFHPNSATLYLPSVSITYGTEVLFRNLIAFEICRPSEGNYVTSYVALMNDLIDSEKDVALLRSVGILTTLLGSDKEVADLFNGLCNEATVRTDDIFDKQRKGVNAHYKNKIRIQFAELVREHFSSPWKALALAAASFMLILTLIQTILTLIQTIFTIIRK